MAGSESTAMTAPRPAGLARQDVRSLPARVRYPSTDEFAFICNTAKMYAQEEMFKELKMGEGAIVAVVLKGYELGVPFMASLDGIRIIKGRPSLSASLMQALAEQRVPGAMVDWENMGDDGVAICVARRAGRSPVRIRFTWDDAKRAQLTSKETYQRYPADLLRAGALRKACRLQYAEVYFGFDVDSSFGVDTDDGVEFVDTTAEEVPEAAAEPTATPAAPPPTPAPATQASEPTSAAAPPPAAGPPGQPEDKVLPFRTGELVGKSLSQLAEKDLRAVIRGFQTSLQKANEEKDDSRATNYTKWLTLVTQWAEFRGIKLAPAQP